MFHHLRNLCSASNIIARTQFFSLAKFGEEEYKFQQIIEYHEERIAANMQLTRPRNNMKLVEVIAEKDSREIKFMFHVSVLVSMSPSEERGVLHGESFTSL